jgi:hypothetical protein
MLTPAFAVLVAALRYGGNARGNAIVPLFPDAWDEISDAAAAN